MRLPIFQKRRTYGWGASFVLLILQKARDLSGMIKNKTLTHTYSDSFSKRVFWGKKETVLPPLDLIAVQKESFQWLLDRGIGELLNEISPIEDFTGKNWILTFNKHYFGTPRYTPGECLDKGLTFDAPLKVV